MDGDTATRLGTSPAPIGDEPKRPRLRHRLKCRRCRADHKPCDPPNREWPQKCERCTKRNLSCSENELAPAKNLSTLPESSTRPDIVVSQVSSNALYGQIDPVEQHPLPAFSFDSTQDALQDPSILHITVPTAAEPNSSAVSEDGDGGSDADRFAKLYDFTLLYQLLLCRLQALYPRGVSATKYRSIAHADHLSRTGQEVTRMVDKMYGYCVQLREQTFRSLCRDDSAQARQDHQELLSILDPCHIDVVDHSLNRQRRQIFRYLVKDRRSQERYSAACLHQLKLAKSYGPNATPRRPSDLKGWTQCLIEMSRRLASNGSRLTAISEHGMSSGAPAPPLHLALHLRLDENELEDVLRQDRSLTRSVDLLDRNILHIAAELNDFNLMAYILKDNSHLLSELVDQRDIVGRTPVLVAAYFCNRACFTLLESAGADLGVQDNDSRSILDLACAAGNTDIVAYLICPGDEAKRWSPDGVHDQLGTTPLHHAAMGGHWNVCELLLSKGAKMDLYDWSTNGLGRSAASLAQATGHFDVAIKLIGADRSGLLLREFQCCVCPWSVPNQVDVDFQIAHHPES